MAAGRGRGRNRRRRERRQNTQFLERRENGETMNSISEHRLVSSQLWRAMNWVDRLRTSAYVRVLSGRHAVVIA